MMSNVSRKKIKPDGYLRVNKFYISASYILEVFLGLLGLIVIYSTLVHPFIMKKWYELQPLPVFSIDSPYLADYTGMARLLLPDGSLLYDGSVDAASAHGNGRLYENGLIVYHGGFENNLYHGSGTEYYTDGTVKYTGGFEQNMYCGEGKAYDSHAKLIYEGNFENGLYNGHGTLYLEPEGIQHTYVGEFENGVQQGLGKLYAEDTLLYEGSFIDGLYAGAGKLYNDNETLLYDGEFIDGVYAGVGKLYHDNEALLYDGEFIDGVYNGVGKLYNDNETLLYDGEFLSGKYDGNGQLFTNNVLLYEGGFVKGLYNGDGKEYDVLTGYPVFEGKYLYGKRMIAGTEFGKDGAPVENPPAPDPDPVTYFGEMYVDVVTSLNKSQVAIKEQYVDGMLLLLDLDSGVAYCFSVLNDKTPGFLLYIYYYGLMSAEGVVVGSEISDIPVISDNNLSVMDLVILGYSNTTTGNNAPSSEIHTTSFYGENHVITAYYWMIPPASPAVDEINEEESSSIDSTEESIGHGKILFLRIEIPSLG